MKKINVAILAVMIFSLISAIVYMIILPDFVLLDFIPNGYLDGFGNKYQYLFVTLATVVLGILTLVIPKLFKMRKKTEKIFLVVASTLVILSAVYGFAILLNVSILELSGIF